MTRFGTTLAWTLILLGGVAVVLLNSAWVLHLVGTVSLPPDRHFPLVATVWDLDGKFGAAGSVTGPFYWVATLTSSLMGGLAFALALRRTASAFAFDLAAAF